MPSQKAIEHTGFIEEISEKGIRVRFVSESACTSCHAKGACSAADMKDKEILVESDGQTYNTGQAVKIIMSQSQGNQAVLLGYVYPLLAFVFALLVLNTIGMEELKAGLISLAVLIPYYLVLIFFKDKINKRFNFSIRKYE